MNFKKAATVASVVLTAMVTQIVGSAMAQPKVHPMVEGRNTLANFAETNKRLADCMHGKGLTFDDRLSKSDVMDAFSRARKSKLNSKDRQEVDEALSNALDDPNNEVVANLPAEDQAFWADAVNECSARIDLEMSGGAGGVAQLEKLAHAAKANPVVIKAGETYVSCMQARGYSVGADPFVAPNDVMEAEHHGQKQAKQLVAGYDKAWKLCVKPYQKALDKATFR